MEPKSHWETVYETKSPDAVSWYAPHLKTSLAYIQRTGLSFTASIIDVGGGEATLVDDLLDANYQHVSVLDISGKALDVCKQRLGPRAGMVGWMAADVLTFPFQRAVFDVWHDRAVFHFLTNEDERQQYVRQALCALRPGGYAIVGTFGPEGPLQCSGLPVSRYAPDELHGEFGPRFRLVESSIDQHTTPWGAQQQFVYCSCRLEH